MSRMRMILIAVFLIVGSWSNVQAQEAPTTYIITSQQSVNGRTCPQLTCTVVRTFAPGEELTATEIVAGDTVNGNDQWPHVSLDGEDLYVHSSLAAPMTKAGTEPASDVTLTPAPTKAPEMSAQDSDYVAQGQAHLEQGDYAQAVEVLSEAIRVNPDNAKAYYYRGSAYREQGEFELAIADLNEAIRLEPEYADAYNLRFCLYNLQNKGDLARADFDEYLRLVVRSVRFQR
jgi:hypothetical protein